MNNLTLAHIGSEVVVLAGMFYYYHRKTSSLQEEINMLRQQNIELSKGLTQLSENMNTLYQALSDNGALPRVSEKKAVKRAVPQKPKTPRATGVATGIEYDTEEESFNEEDLDKIVDAEIKPKTPVKKPATPKKKEECSDDECTLVD